MRAIQRLLLSVVVCGSSFFLRAQGTSQDPTTARGMHDAVALAERGDTSGALRALDPVLAQHPAFAPALKLRGLLLEDAGDQPGAARAYAAALAASPRDPELQLKVGVADLVAGRTADAVALLRQHTAAAPGDPDGFFYLAQALHKAGDDAAALQAIRRAAVLAPLTQPGAVARNESNDASEAAAIAQKYGELLCSSGDCAAGLEQLQAALAHDPTLPRIQYDLAFASFSNEDLEQAETFAVGALQQQPGDLEAMALLGSTHVKLARWSDAEPLLRRVLAARPDDSGLLVQLGHTELELKQYADAVTTLTEALHKDPTQAIAHFFLARAYTALGDTGEARHQAELHARMMQEFSFNVPEAAQRHEDQMTRQAETLLAAGNEGAALQLFIADTHQPERNQPGSRQAHSVEASAWLAVGATWLRMNDSQHSRRALERALELDPSIKGAYTYLGFLALEQNNLPEAEKNFRAELKGDPNHPEALAELGEVSYRQGRWNDTVADIVRSKTGSPRFLYMLADADFHLGNTEAADIAAESLVAHAHGSPEVMGSLAELLRRNGQTVLAERLMLPAATSPAAPAQAASPAPPR